LSGGKNGNRDDEHKRASEDDAASGGSLAGWIEDMSRKLGRVYYRHRHFYRRMIVTLVAQENADTQRAALEFSFRMFEMPLTRLQERGLLSADIPAALLARHVAHSVSGSLQQRLMERGSEDGLAREIEMGLLLLLSGICPDAERQMLRDRMSALADSTD
jgi:hypothetical protein